MNTEQPTDERVSFVDDAGSLQRVLERASAAPRLALDLEGNGMFAYRARICTMQLAWEQEGGVEVAIVDARACDPASLKGLLQSPTPLKVVHDVAFDARMLRERGVLLDYVHDTALCAAYAGRRATGLSALLHSELGIEVDKSMQVSDWGRRPLDPASLCYLAADVAHLLALETVLWDAARALGIEDEVATETEYRLRAAWEEPAEVEPLLRMKGLDRLDDASLAVLRELSLAREALAKARDVPPFRIATDAALGRLARSRPGDEEALRKALPDADQQVAAAMWEAVQRGILQGGLGEEQRALLRRPQFDRNATERIRRREKRLSSWRQAEAERRGVDPQVVLAGHCLRRLAAGQAMTAEQIARVEGLGQARAARYAEHLAALLSEAENR